MHAHYIHTYTPHCANVASKQLTEEKKNDM